MTDETIFEVTREVSEKCLIAAVGRFDLVPSEGFRFENGYKSAPEA